MLQNTTVGGKINSNRMVHLFKKTEFEKVEKDKAKVLEEKHLKQVESATKSLISAFKEHQQEQYNKPESNYSFSYDSKYVNKNFIVNETLDDSFVNIKFEESKQALRPEEKSPLGFVMKNDNLEAVRNEDKLFEDEILNNDPSIEQNEALFKEAEEVKQQEETNAFEDFLNSQQSSLQEEIQQKQEEEKQEEDKQAQRRREEGGMEM